MAKFSNKAKQLPSQADLREFLDYDPNTGALHWKHRSEEHFANHAHFLRWNKVYAGKPCGTISARGHLLLRIRDRGYRAHRLIWKLVRGVDPIEIDHINGNPLDNSISNLRSVSRGENARNMPLIRSSKTGVPGVRKSKRGNTWTAEITLQRKRVALGTFAKAEEAVNARKEAEKTYGFHANHGRSPLSAGAVRTSRKTLSGEGQ